MADTGFASPCWLWLLAKDKAGYGFMRERGGPMVYAHRALYENVNGPVPYGLQLDHLCRVPSCVNPDHLEPVTPAENCRRGVRTKLTPTEVSEIRASSDTQRIIGRRFGISQGHVSRIRSNKTWR